MLLSRNYIQIRVNEMKQGFMFGLAITAGFLVVLISPVQSQAQVNAECTLNCQASLTECLANTVTMDPDEKQAGNEVCEEQKETCLSGCNGQQDTEGK